MLADGQWVAALFALAVGTEIATASYAIGMDLGRSTFTWWERRVRREAEKAGTAGSGSAGDVPIVIDSRQPAAIPTVYESALSSHAAESSEHGEESGAVTASAGMVTTSEASSTAARNETSASSFVTVARAPAYVIASAAALLLAFLGGAVALLVADRNWSRRTIALSVLLGPAGALLRWRLAERFNAKTPRMPLGTLLANLLASLLDVCVATVMVGRSVRPYGQAGADAAIGGFGGALSTVSTWVVELSSLRAAGMAPAPAFSVKYVYLYWATSVGGAQILGIVIYGSTVWSRRAQRKSV
jgi:fluoride ion exporter CrcB/FEX